MIPRLVVLTDRAQLPPGRTMLETLLAAIDAGLRAVLLRGPDVHLAAVLASRVHVITARELAPRADAVHLAAHQPAVSHPHGRSCHSPEDVGRAVAEGASYVTISPVASSVSKPGYGPELGIGGVRGAVAAADDVPVYALGGVTPQNAASWRAAGAYGVAAMGAVMRADDPGLAVRKLMEALDG